MTTHLSHEMKLVAPSCDKVVYLGMVGDVIHPGIINILNEAQKHGRVLVGLFTDSAIAGHKRLPHMTYEQRRIVVENLKGVWKVVPQEQWSYVPNLEGYKPDYIIHGDDWQVGPDRALRDDVYKVMASLGRTVIEVPYTQGINSSILTAAASSIGTTPEVRLKALRRLLAVKKPVVAIEAHSGLSSLIVENLEVETAFGKRFFDAIWSSSLTDSTSKGKPDIEAVDLTARLHGISDILECTTKPIIYDGDTGGLPEHFAFTVRTLERLGVSAVIVEDKAGLKKNSLFGTEAVQTLATIEEFALKLATGKKAQVTRDFMVIARLESLIAGGTVEEALERAVAFSEAGADGIMIHSKEKTGVDVRSFCEKFRRLNASLPLVLVPTTYNHFFEDDLASWGANLVIHANHLLRASYPAMVSAATSILQHRRSVETESVCMPVKSLLNLIPGTR